jgi:hypothetical protein
VPYLIDGITKEKKSLKKNRWFQIETNRQHLDDGNSLTRQIQEDDKLMNENIRLNDWQKKIQIKKSQNVEWTAKVLNDVDNSWSSRKAEDLNRENIKMFSGEMLSSIQYVYESWKISK